MVDVNTICNLMVEDRVLHLNRARFFGNLHLTETSVNVSKDDDIYSWYKKVVDAVKSKYPDDWFQKILIALESVECTLTRNCVSRAEHDTDIEDLRAHIKTVESILDEFVQKYKDAEETKGQVGSKGNLAIFKEYEQLNNSIKHLKLEFVEIAQVSSLAKSLQQLSNIETIDFSEILVQEYDKKPEPVVAKLENLREYKWQEILDPKDLHTLKQWYNSYSSKEFVSRLMWADMDESFKVVAGTLRMRLKKLKLIDVNVYGIQLFKLEVDKKELTLTFDCDNVCLVDFELKRLILSRCRIPESLKSKIHMLKYLNLYNVDGSSANLLNDILPHMQDLQEAIISLNDVDGFKPEISIPSLANLQKLCITGCKIKNFAQCMNLTTMHLATCTFSKTCLTGLKDSIPNLKFLSLNEVTNHHYILDFIIAYALQKRREITEVLVLGYVYERKPNPMQKRVQDFLEKYPNIQGKRHFCLENNMNSWTTKEVVTDKSFQEKYFDDFQRSKFLTFEAYQLIKGTN